MRLDGVRVGFVVTGSHCNLDKAIPVVKKLVDEGADVTPVASASVATTDTKHGTAESWLTLLREITGKEPLTSIPEVEPFGPEKLMDVVVICPCTGNTMAKLANGITDSAATMAAKAQLRNGRPVVLAVTTNDALGVNARNLGVLMATRNVYIVPFGQDNPQMKPASIAPNWEQVVPTVLEAIEGRQIQPLLIQL